MNKVDKPLSTPESEYSEEFFAQRVGEADHAAKVVCQLLKAMLPRFESVVDVGCGTGTWLATFRRLGVIEILGYEGNLNNLSLLEIPDSNFLKQDLKEPIRPTRKFDLALCLEVAEHLPAKNAETLIHSLTALSDFVLFSAAIPGQGGLHHLNEQWQEYWVKKFEKKDFIPFDCIRPEIWNDPKISFWYKQNTLLFVSTGKIDQLTLSLGRHFNPNLVHPDLFSHKCKTQEMDSTPFEFKSIVRKVIKRILQ